jgi:hypothetical protein
MLLYGTVCQKHPCWHTKKHNEILASDIYGLFHGKISKILFGIKLTGESIIIGHCSNGVNITQKLYRSIPMYLGKK